MPAINEYFDILAQYGTDCAGFQADTAAVDVAISNPAAGGGYLRTSGGLAKFARGDNFIIHSMGFTLPGGFDISRTGAGGTDSLPGVTFAFQETSLALGTFQNCVNFLPFANYELAAGFMVDSRVFNDAFRLRAIFSPLPRVSMAGVPAALHGVAFPVIIWAKIIHTNILTTWP